MKFKKGQKICHYCHGNFYEEALNFNEGFKRICDYCLDEVRGGTRKDRDCPECLREMTRGKCLTRGCRN